MLNIVISGPNFTGGGPLSVMKDLLLQLNTKEEIKVTALIHSKKLYEDKEFSNITFLEFPDSKKSWLRRLRYEYFYFSRLSKELRPDVWISMHDITPNVDTDFLVTYCHNPSPFYKTTLKDFFYDKKFGLFTLFYRYLYQINIKKNDFVFVQQNWMKEKFETMFNISNVVVARPEMHIAMPKSIKKDDSSDTVFFYPSFPRVFKNLEVICQAVEFLEKEKDISNFTVILTIDGSENKYAHDIVQRYIKLKSINFVGLLSRDDVYKTYSKTDVLLFPSKLETWGLPISEFKEYNGSLLVADLPYAKETVGNYQKVSFFSPENFKKLATLMHDHIIGKPVYQGNLDITEEGSLVGWGEFIDFIQEKYKEKHQ